MGKNNVIGTENRMPWHLPSDFKFFKETTMKKPIVMGRKTFQSIGKALPGRVNIVITRDKEWQAEGCIVLNSLNSGIDMAEQMALVNGVDEIMIVGGADIYAQTIDDADRIYITEVDIEPQGDAKFPDIDSNVWKKTSTGQDICENDITFRFVQYDK